MSTIVDRAASVGLGIASLVFAVVLVHREFFSTQASATAPAKSAELVGNWTTIAKNARVIGSETAPIQLVEFSDFECPFCAKFDVTVDSMRAKWGSQLGIQFVHVPLDGHKHAAEAARASECAADQGRFAEIKTALFQGRNALGAKSWTEFAKSAGVADTATFERCMSSSDSKVKIDSGMIVAERFKIRGTPTVLLNGWRLSSPPRFATLDSAAQRIVQGKKPF